MGGGVIIIVHQSEILKNALQDPVFYGEMCPQDRDLADGLIGKSCHEWTKGDRKLAATLLEGSCA